MQEIELAMTDKLVWLKPGGQINRMYISMDGTGVPMRAAELAAHQNEHAVIEATIGQVL